MNKSKFEAYLRDKLSILQEEEIDEILAEYLQHIDMRVKEGVSEEEAIADFGDLDDLVNDLLDAYKINRNERDFENFENRLKHILNTSMDFINRIAASIMKRSSGEIIGIIVEFLVACLAVGIINSVIGSLLGSFSAAFYFRPYFLTSIIRFVINIIRIVLTTSLSLSIFYWFAKERVLNNEDQDEAQSNFQKQEPSHKFNNESNFNEDSNIKDVKPDVEIVNPEVIDAQDMRVKTDSVNMTMNQESKKTVDMNETTTQRTAKMDIPKPKKEKSFSKKIVDFNMNIIRVFVAILLIPGLVLGVLMGIGFVMLLYATVMGYGSIGLSLVVFGGLFVYYYFTIVFIKFVGGKN